jgi:hypothetical protein
MLHFPPSSSRLMAASPKLNIFEPKTTQPACPACPACPEQSRGERSRRVISQEPLTHTPPTRERDCATSAKKTTENRQPTISGAAHTHHQRERDCATFGKKTPKTANPLSQEPLTPPTPKREIARPPRKKPPKAKNPLDREIFPNLTKSPILRNRSTPIDQKREKARTSPAATKL